MSDAGKGGNTAKRTNFKKFWENYPDKWKTTDTMTPNSKKKDNED